MHFSSLETAPIQNKAAALCNGIFITALSLLGLLSVIVCLYNIALLRWDGPFRDTWEFVGHIREQLNGNWSWAYLIDAYGGAHRILLPKLIFWLDYRYFHANNLLPIAVAIACQLTYLQTMNRHWQHGGIQRAERLALGSLLLMALFNAGQLFNFLYAMDVQWFMANTLALLALFCACHGRGAGWNLTALLLAAAASLCNFTGLIAVPLVALIIALLEQNRARIAAIIVCALLLIWSYVNTGKSGDNLVLNALLNSRNLTEFGQQALTLVAQIVPFSLKMLSNPLSRHWPLLAQLCACAALLFTLWQTVIAIRQRDRIRLLLVGLIWYIAIGCAFTALGRVIYPNSATAERYLTLTLPLTGLICTLILLQFPQRTIRAIALLGGVFFYWHNSASSLQNISLISQQTQQAYMAARSDVLALDAIRGTLSFPMARQGHNAVAEFNSYFSQQQLAYFHSPPFYQRQESIRADLPVCQGHLTLKPLTDQHYRLEGQLHHEDFTPHLISVQQQHILGFGLLRYPPQARLPWRKLDLHNHYFIAFASQLNPAQAVELFGHDRHGQLLCQLTIAPANINKPTD